MEPFITPSVDQDEDDLREAREELQAEFGEEFVHLQTKYFFAAHPLCPVGAVAVGNSHDWAAYIAGIPSTAAPGAYWLHIYRHGAKLPEAAARGWFNLEGPYRP